MMDSHQILLSNNESAVRLFQPGDRVHDVTFGAGTIKRPITGKGYLPTEFDADPNSVRYRTPNHLSLLSETVNDDNAVEEPLPDDEQTLLQDAGISQALSDTITDREEDAEKSDGEAAINDWPAAPEDELLDAEIVIDESLESEFRPTPITTEESTTGEEDRQVPDPTVNVTSERDRDATSASSNQAAAPLAGYGLSRDLLMPDWVVFCVGIGQCGTNIVTAVNKKPEQLPSRNPVYYPVHCSQFDTHMESVSDGLPQVKTNTVRATQEEADITGGQAADTAGTDRLGVGGKPYASYLAFKRIFDDAKLDELDDSEVQSELGQYDADYFQNPLWARQDGSKIGAHEEVRLTGDISSNGDYVANYGLITFNSARGGTGSGGVPWIHNFMKNRSHGRGRRISMGLSLNVSVLPDFTQAAAKKPLPANTVSSYYRLSQSWIHGVILVSNEALVGRNKHDIDLVNEKIKEMLVPIIVSPTGKYTVRRASSTTDQADISKAISSTGPAGLCVIGFAEESLTDGTVPDDLMRKIAQDALKGSSCDWIPRSGLKPTGYLAFLSGPPDFFESRPAKLTSDLLAALTNEIRERSERPGYPSLSSIDGDVSVQAFAQAKSVRLSVLLYNVKVPEFDDLVKKGLDQNNISYGSDFDGWDQILSLTEDQVARLEGQQVGPASPSKENNGPSKIFEL
jgi:hypothetical protein